MCGIIGYIGSKNATDIFLDGLRRLEYRGYDSAGIAVFEKNKIQLIRSEGKLEELTKRIRLQPPKGPLGIGHTRWATHGRPSETNAHPHKAGSIVLVHNGIVENYLELRSYLKKKGHTIKSETDTELVCHLIQQRMYDGLSMAEAFEKALSELKGSYALVVMNEQEPDRLYVARNGSPLVVGFGKGEGFVASDVSAILSHTRKVLFLEDGDSGILTRQGLKLKDDHKKFVQREVKEILWSQAMAEKGGFKHFMQKEIFEQPRAITETLAGRIAEKQGRFFLNGVEEILLKSKRVPFDKIYLVACGTSYHAALTGQYYFEEFVGLSVRAELASEFRYRKPLLDSKTLLVTISQSGETADTLAVIKEARKKGARILSICNVVDSSIPRASHATFYTHAGPEIGVASTKAFTTQLLLLLVLALHLGSLRGIVQPKVMREAIEALVKLPQQMEKLLKKDGALRTLAKKYAQCPNFLYFGRGVGFPIALEGALKLKEISYIHAEGYAAGEMKHGPIALINEGMPVVVLAPQDKTHEKIISNLEEVRARGAAIIAVVHEGDTTLANKCSDIIEIPLSPWYVTPILMVLPLQQLAYHIADHKGTDVDQPRNLAKSVTVE